MLTLIADDLPQSKENIFLNNIFHRRFTYHDMVHIGHVVRMSVFGYTV